MKSENRDTIVVIGGGLAGISASLLLADQGHQVILVEAKRFLGGRVGSFHDKESNQWVDFCQHVGMNCCTHLKWLIDRLGQSTSWEVQKTLHFYTSTGEHVEAKGWPLPAPLHLAGLLLKWPELTLADRIRIGFGMLCLIRLPKKQIGSWQNQSAAAWLLGHYQTKTAIGRFWSTILTSALGEQMDRITLGAAHKVLIDGFIANRTAYHLLVPKHPLSRLIGTEGKIALKNRGVDVRLESPVSEVLFDKGIVSGVRIPSETIECHRVIVAVPWHAIGKLFSEETVGEPSIPFRSFQESRLESAPITGIHTWWDRPWLKSPHAILIDRLCHWVFPGPNESAESDSKGLDSNYYQIVISGSRDLPKGDHQAILDAVVRDLQEVFAECRSSRLLRARVVTDPNAVFSVSIDHQAGRLPCDLFAEKNIWLAGDWTDTGWPATMEGAILSGHKAANALSKSMKS